MAAQEYFGSQLAPSNRQYLQQSTQYNPPSYSQSPYEPGSPYLTPSASHDLYSNKPSPSLPSEASALPSPDPFSDRAALKPSTTKLVTQTPGWQPHPAQSPLSPEAITPTDPLRPRRKRRSPKKKGFFAGPIPWVVYGLTLVQLTVFVVEIIKNSIITGSPIMIHPQFNPMIGPSTYVLINMGARFVPCMRTTPGVQNATVPIEWPCPNTTTTDAQCTLNELCGLGGLNFDHPNQWYRFIVPIFLHAGLIHIGFNMLLQMTMGREIERLIGSVRFALVYFSSGIFGFVLGGNYAATAIASTGASGCLFGILALVLLDLLYSWQERESPVRDLMWILFDIIISLVLGLLPGLDNFSHIGGFIMGFALGVCILHSPTVLRERIASTDHYRDVSADIAMSSGARPEEVSPVSVASSHNFKRGPNPSSRRRSRKKHKDDSFFTSPVGFFQGRKPLWWAWWLIRAGALIGVLIGFVVLLMNFYRYRDTCAWCKYLSCLPINNWCELGNLTLTQQSSNSKRSLVDAGARIIMRKPWRA